MATTPIRKKEEKTKEKPQREMITILSVGMIVILLAGMSWAMIMSAQRGQELTIKEWELSQEINKHDITKMMLNQTESNLTEIRTEYNKLEENYSRTLNKKEDLEEDVDDAEGEINYLNSKIANLKEELENSRIGNRYKTHDPTHQEIVEFLEEDETDEIEYEPDEYWCTHFCRDVKKNANDKGIRMGICVLRVNGSDHMVLCAYTTDQGTIFIEPHTDKIFVPIDEYGEKLETKIIIW